MVKSVFMLDFMLAPTISSLVILFGVTSEYKSVFIVSFLLLLFWFMLIGSLLLWVDKMKPKLKPKKRTGSRKQKARRFRRRRLPFFLVLRCRTRGPSNAPPIVTHIRERNCVTARRWTLCDRQHLRWRRNQRRSRHRAWRRRQTDHERFLTPKRSSSTLWNERRVIDSAFLAENTDMFLPHYHFGVVTEDVLHKRFCCRERRCFSGSNEAQIYVGVY